MEYNFIHTEIKEHVFALTLNRPDKHNALNIDMVRELNHCFSKIKNTDSLHAVFIFGNPKSFSAGGDLKEMKTLEKSEAQKRSSFVQDTFCLLNEIKIPVVAFIQGICFGGGLELALHSDFRICADTAKLALPEIKYGMIPGAGGTVQLPWQMGSSEAAFYLLTGEQIPLDKALHSGLVQKVLREEEYNKEVESLRSYFSSASLQALKAIKVRLLASKNKSLKENYKQESHLFAELLTQQGHIGIEKNFIKNR